jgi:uncharacterized protein (TIGR03067 family)
LVVVTAAIPLVALVLTDGYRQVRDFRAEVGRLDGQWDCVSMSISGKAVRRGQWEGVKLTIAGRDWTVGNPADPDRAHQKRAVAMDLRRTPKRIEFSDEPFLRSPSSPPGRFRWVYALDGDTLKVSYNIGTWDYPAKVDGGEEHQLVWEYRRVKKR